MKAICSRAQLLEALQFCASVVPSRSSKQVLECAKLSVTTAMTVSATDLMQYASCVVDGTADLEPGSTLVNAAQLLAVVRGDESGVLKLEVVGDVLEVRGDDSVYKLPACAADQFPPTPTIEAKGIVVNGDALHGIIDRVLWAANNEANRIPAAVRLEIADGKITSIATDGRVLASDELTAEKLPTGGVNVPTEAAVTLLKLLAMGKGDQEWQAQLWFDDNRLSVSGGPATLTVNLAEGSFPPWRDIVPKDCEFRLTASAEGLASAVKRAAIMAPDNSYGLKLALSGSKAALSLRSDDGEAQIDCAIEYRGKDFEIGVNPSYLLQALRAAGDGDVRLGFNAPNRPILVRSGTAYQCVIMPMSLKE